MKEATRGEEIAMGQYNVTLKQLRERFGDDGAVANLLSKEIDAAIREEIRKAVKVRVSGSGRGAKNTPWGRIVDDVIFPRSVNGHRLRALLFRRIKYTVQKAAKDCYRMGEWGRYYRIPGTVPKRPPAPVRDWTDACFFVEDKYKVKV